MIIRSLMNRFRAVQGHAWAGLVAFALAQPALATSYIVKLKGDAKAFQAVTAQKSLSGVQITDSHPSGHLVAINLNSSDKNANATALAKIMSRSDVEYVVENKKVHTFESPNDPEFGKQWSMAKVRAAEAWASGTGSHNVVVAVTDTGVDYNHSDLKDNIWHNTKEIPGNGIDDDKNGFVDDVVGYDFNKNDADPMDETGQNPGHGTHCAGIMGAVGNNGKGISGMSQVLSIMPVRFLGADGSGDLMGAAKAIDYAVGNGANVISASWGAAISENDAKPVIEAISRANDKGVIFVVAAANDGKDNDTTAVYPANTNLPNVIAVAASNSTDAKPSWSNYGLRTIHLAAPGDGIYSTLPGEKFGNLSGTSMATPLVSGLVGLVLSHNPALKGPEVKAILQASGTKVAIETACECRVDAANAVARVTGNTLTVVPQAATLAPNQTLQFSAIGGSKAGYKFASSADSIATVDANGLLTAKSNGEVNVTVTDSAGTNNTSLRIRVVTEDNGGGGGGGGGDGGGGGGGGGGDQDCPLGDPQTCQLLCQIEPTLPWCK